MFDEKISIVTIWTTPWTLPGNTGITVGGDFDYSIVDVGNERYIIVSELVDMKIAGIEEYKKKFKSLKVKRWKAFLQNILLLDRKSRVVIGSGNHC